MPAARSRYARTKQAGANAILTGQHRVPMVGPSGQQLDGTSSAGADTAVVRGIDTCFDSRLEYALVGADSERSPGATEFDGNGLFVSNRHGWREALEADPPGIDISRTGCGKYRFQQTRRSTHVNHRLRIEIVQERIDARTILTRFTRGPAAYCRPKLSNQLVPER